LRKESGDVGKIAIAKQLLRPFAEGSGLIVLTIDPALKIMPPCNTTPATDTMVTSIEHGAATLLMSSHP
jgi:hypothetical protein